MQLFSKPKLYAMNKNKLYLRPPLTEGTQFLITGLLGGGKLDHCDHTKSICQIIRATSIVSLMSWKPLYKELQHAVRW